MEPLAPSTVFFKEVITKATQGLSSELDRRIRDWANVTLTNLATPELIEKCAKEIVSDLEKARSSSLRWRPAEKTAKQQLIKVIFERSMNVDSKCIIRLAEQIDHRQRPFYPKWKEVCFINIPKQAAKLLGNPLCRLALVIGVFIGTGAFCYAAYEPVRTFFVGRIVTIIINKTPLVIIKLGNLMAATAEWVLNNGIFVLIGLYATQMVLIRFLPHSLSDRIRNVSLVALIRPFYQSDDFWVFVLKRSVESLSFTWEMSGKISTLLAHSVHRTKHTRLALCTQKARAVWVNQFKPKDSVQVA